MRAVSRVWQFAAGASSVALALVVFRSWGQWTGLSIVLGVAAGLAAGVAITTLLLSEALQARVLMASLSLALSLYLAEIATTVLAEWRSPGGGQRSLGKIEQLRGEGRDAHPLVLPTFFVGSNGLASGSQRLFPLGTISRISTVLAGAGASVTIETDEHGFNNPLGIWPGGEAVDIIVVGDSFAFGYSVPPGEEIAGQLRARGWNTLSVGSGGNGPLIELATLKEYVEPLEPRVVVWLYFEGNDLDELQRELESPTLKKYLDRDFSQRLLWRQEEVDARLREWALDAEQQMREGRRRERVAEWVRGRGKLTTLRSHLGLTASIQHRARFDPLFGQILELAEASVSSWGGELFFVYLPAVFRYHERVRGGYRFEREEVLDCVRGLEIPLIDVQRVFDESDDPATMFSAGMAYHYSAAGYRAVAGSIDRQIRRAGAVPPVATVVE